MAHKAEGTITEETGINGLEWRVAPGINSIKEVIVTRDIDAEMIAFSDKYSEYKQHTDKLRPRWPNPYPDEYYKLEEETFNLIPQFNKERKREIDPRYHSEYISGFWKNRAAIANIWKDLEIIEKDPSVVTTETCASLVSKAWSSIEGHNIDYSDYPTENKEYVCILNEVFQPTLDTISRACQNLSEDRRTEIANELKNFVVDSQDYNTWFFDRIQAVAEAIVDIRGTRGLKDIADIIDELENVRENRYKQDLEDQREMQDLQRSINENPLNEGEDTSLSAEDRESIRKAKEYYEGDASIDATYLEWDESDHYHLHMNLVRHISSKEWTEDEKPQVAEFLCRFMEKESAGSLGAYVEAFQTLGIESSLQSLLKNLKNENVLAQRMSAEVLYRLELGKIGITSEDGVKYFDKLYKLVKEDDPDFFVKLYSEGNAYIQRVDTKGRIGVFNADQRLLGAFNLDLLNGNHKIEAPVTEITSKDVFLPKADETPDERKIRESMLELYLAQYGKIYDEIHDQTGIRLNSLDLHEQGWFIAYYSKEDEQGKQGLLAFTKRYGEIGLKVFLALDYGESAQEVISYANSSERAESTQRELFRQFNSISNRALEWRQIFDKLNESKDYNFAPEIHEALIRKCSEYFRAALMIERGEGGDVKMKELLHSMKSVAFALQELKQLYSDDSDLVLENKVFQDEYKDNEKTERIPNARTTWTLKDSKTGSKIIITSRPVGTANLGGGKLGGAARLNFKVVSADKEYETRIGVDLENVQGDNGEVQALSLDLGTGRIDSKADIYPTQRVGRVLGLVEGSEGGHNVRSFSSEAIGHFEGLARNFSDFMNEKY